MADRIWPDCPLGLDLRKPAVFLAGDAKTAGRVVASPIHRCGRPADFGVVCALHFVDHSAISSRKVRLAASHRDSHSGLFHFLNSVDSSL